MIDWLDNPEESDVEVMRPSLPHPLALHMTAQDAVYVRDRNDNWVLCTGVNAVDMLSREWPTLSVTDDQGRPVSWGFLKRTYSLPLGGIHYSCNARPFKADKNNPTQTLELELYPHRNDVEPRFDTDVDTWLTKLHPGPQLRAWLSWLGEVSTPAPALVLAGEPGTGKSMLAQACMGYYAGGSVDLHSLLGGNRFALAPMKDTPIVWGDEMVAGFASGKASGIFRSLIGNSHHNIEEKGKPLVTIEANARCIITSNSRSVVGVSGKHSAADLNAVLSRVVGLDIGKEAASWLKAKGGRTFTADWIQTADNKPGRLVQHIAWLQSQRGAMGVRFAVDAYLDTTLADGAILSSHLGTSVWEVVAHAIASGNTSVAQLKSPDVVHVNASGVWTAWAACGGDLKARPSRGAVASTLGSVTETSEVLDTPAGPASYWAVPGSYIVKAALGVGLPNVGELSSKIARGNVTPLTTTQEKTSDNRR